MFTEDGQLTRFDTCKGTFSIQRTKYPPIFIDMSRAPHTTMQRKTIHSATKCFQAPSKVHTVVYTQIFSALPWTLRA
jgi:hypothetical protein